MDSGRERDYPAVSEEIDREAIQSEIDEAHASLLQLHNLFNGREMPLPVAKMERTIRAQLEAAQDLLG